MQPKIPLLIRLPNWVGDVVMTIPSLQALQSAGFELQLIGRPWIFDLLQVFPAKLLSMPKSLSQARQQAQQASSDKALLFTNSFSSALIMYSAGKKTIGYKNTLRNCLLNKQITKPPHLHEAEYFWEIAKLAATTWLPHSSWPQTIPPTIHLPVSSVSNIKVSARLKQEKIDTPFIILCPSATGTAPNGIPKIWPYWSALSQTLEKRGIKHLVCPGPLEETRCQQLVPKATCLTGINLSELAALFTQADLVLANDSGPMHIACAVGAPVLGIFGATDPKRTAPWGGKYLGKLGQWPSLDEVLAVVLDSMTAPVLR